MLSKQMEGKLMAETKQGEYQIDFESLIKVLGVNLYANPKASIRELIQNANDSLVRRGEVDAFTPAIRIKAHREAGQLVLEDNGAGMVEEEVITYLASIGGGRTRSERQRLMTTNQQAAQMLIGQFGIGFLSSFVVADRVIVNTCSFSDGDPVYWECEGTTEYQIGLGQRTTPGTEITLFLKPAQYGLLEEDVLREAIIRYADFISFPIYLNDGPQVINSMNAPWHLDATEFEYVQYIERRYGVAPLSLKSITVEQEDLQVMGALFIPPQSAKFKQRLRSVDLFQKRMYVNEDLNLLPEWAGFVCAILDCPTVELMASREAAISENESYRTLQKYLGEAVTDFVKRLAQYERPVFLEVIRQHDWRVLHGAIRNDEFFDQVKDLIPLHSDMGPITMSKYLQRIPPRPGNLKTIYYIPGEQPLGQQQSSLFKAQGIPIIQADMAAVQFLKKYAHRVENVDLRELAFGVIDLMEPAEDAYWRTLEARYQELGIVAKAVKFEPMEMPGMAVRQSDYDQNRLIEQILGGTNSLTDLMDRAGKEKSDAYGLAFNIANPIVQQLNDYEGDPTVLNTALRAIYASALLSACVELTPELSQGVAHDQMRIIELLLEQAGRIETGQTVGPYDISLFAAMQNRQTGRRLLKMAHDQCRSGNLEQAEALLLKAAEIDFEGQYTAYINLGAIYANQDRYKEAQVALTKAIEIAPEKEDAYIALAQSLEAQQLWTQAATTHKKIGELSAEFRLVAQIKMALCLNKAGQVEEAIAELNQLREDNPQEAQVYIALAQLHEEQQRWDEAIQVYEQASALDPELAVKAKIEELQRERTLTVDPCRQSRDDKHSSDEGG